MNQWIIFATASLALATGCSSDYVKHMRNELQIRQRVMCGILAVCTCAVYLGFCLLAAGGAWQRKEGNLAASSSWIQSASLFAMAFPFGFLPGFRSLFVAPILNGLLWSLIVGSVYARHLRRKIG